VTGQEEVLISGHGVDLAQVGQEARQLEGVLRQDGQGPGQAGHVDPVPDDPDAADLLGMRVLEGVLQAAVRSAPDLTSGANIMIVRCFARLWSLFGENICDFLERLCYEYFYAYVKYCILKQKLSYYFTS
jgi:hypothetical protein